MEEIKTPVTVGKPPMPFGDRVHRMSEANLLGETRRVARTDRYHGIAIALALIVMQFKAPIGGNDPYLRKANPKRQAGTGGLIPR